MIYKPNDRFFLTFNYLMTSCNISGLSFVIDWNKHISNIDDVYTYHSLYYTILSIESCRDFHSYYNRVVLSFISKQHYDELTYKPLMIDSDKVLTDIYELLIHRGERSIVNELTKI